MWGSTSPGRGYTSRFHSGFSFRSVPGVPDLIWRPNFDPRFQEAINHHYNRQRLVRSRRVPILQPLHLPVTPGPWPIHVTQAVPMDDTKQEMSLTPRTVLVRTLWEGKEVPCLQVRREGVVISRRGDNNMVNGTKLLEVAGMSRHKSNVILKKEKSREVIATGPAHFKGVWIPYHRALELANTEKITKLLHPLFVPDMGSVTISVGNEDVRTEIARVGKIYPEWTDGYLSSD